MRRLSKQDYEAIAAYDGDKNPAARAVVVIDPSHCNSALCVCDAKRHFEAVNLWCREDICFEDEIKGTFDFKEHEDEIREAIRKYYLTDKCVDKVISGIQKTASALMEQFNKSVGEELETYLKLADRVLENEKIDPAKIRVVFVGNMARFFPAEAVARLHFSVALPMMADNKYGYYEDLAEATERGNAIIEKNKVKLIVGPVEWVVCSKGVDEDPEEYRICLAEDGESVESFAFPKYTPKVFACEGDELTVFVAGKLHKIVLSDSFFSSRFGMLRLGIQFEDEKAFLIVEADGRSERYPVDIKIKGE